MLEVKAIANFKGRYDAIKKAPQKHYTYLYTTFVTDVFRFCEDNGIDFEKFMLEIALSK